MIYKHYKGGEYEFVALAYNETTLQPTVVYRSCKDGTVWTRPASEFFGVATINADGTVRLDENEPTMTKFVSRFTPQPNKEK